MRAAATSHPRLAIVVSTYEWPEALDAVLRSFAEQSDQRFTLVVADDGSGPDTKALVDGWRTSFGERLVHAWQPDEGFRLARVLNLGALAVDADYLAFMHGESIPRRHFVRALRSCVEPGWFAAARRVDVSHVLTRRILAEQLPVHRWGMLEWHRSRRQVGSLRALTRRDRRRVGARGVPEFVPHDRTYGYLLGVARTDFERVNGYDMRFVGWGEEDVDIAVQASSDRPALRARRAGRHVDPPLARIGDTGGAGELAPAAATERSDRIEAIEGLRELAESGPTTGNEGVVSRSPLAER